MGKNALNKRNEPNERNKLEMKLNDED